MTTVGEQEREQLVLPISAGYDTLQAVVNASPAAIVAADREGRVTIWNAAAERMFGWRSDEVLGTVLPILPPEEEAAIRDLHARVLAGQVVTDSDAQRKRKDGSYVEVSLSLSPLHDADGGVSGTMGVFLDLSERNRMRQQLAAAERKYRTLVEQIPAVTYIEAADPAGTILYVSPQVESLFGVTPQEWIEGGLDIWLDCIHPDDRERVLSDYLHATQRREVYDVIYRAISRDGTMRWFRDYATPLARPEGEPVVLHGVMLDITDQKVVEEQLETSLELLRDAGDTRQRLLSALLGAETEERRRIASEIHDDSVQAMTAVGLRLSALRGRMPAAELEELEQIERVVGESIARLRRLLFELRPPDLAHNGLATTLRTLLEQARSEFGIAVELEDELDQEPTIGLRAVIYRVVQEAVANTLRHAGASRVVVRLERVKGGALVSVSDDGAGFTSNGSEPSAPGKLGLASMRERVELAGGWFNVDTVPDAGTTIELWLPGETPAFDTRTHDA